MNYRIVKYENNVKCFYKIEKKGWFGWHFWSTSRENYFSTLQQAEETLEGLTRVVQPFTRTIVKELA